MSEEQNTNPASNAVEDTKVEEVKEAASSTVEETVEVKEESEAASDAVEVPKKFKKLVEEVENMSVLELNELVKVLEKKFGVSAVAMAAPAAAAEAAEEKSDFTVHLKDSGASKIGVIKVIKEVLGLGLKEAKDLVDGAPGDIKSGVKKEEAEEMKKKLEEAGATVELK